MSLFQFLIEHPTQPDILGEALRHLFFNQDDGKYGCYSTFELRDGIEKLPDEKVEEDDDFPEIWHHAQTTIEGMKIHMSYMWDGDGTLIFTIDDKYSLYNGDCKKSHVWQWEVN